MSEDTVSVIKRLLVTDPVKRLTAEQVLGRLAASLNLVPEGSALSASELQQHLQQRPQLLQDCLQTQDS